MGNLEKRLERLEGAADENEARREPSEEEKKRHWLAAAGARRNQALGRGGVWQVRDVIKLLRGRREATSSAEEFRERLLAWRPPLDRRASEREFARSVFLREPGTEAMTCPEEWRESFEAGAELLRFHDATPDEVLAEGYLALKRIEEDGNEEEKRWWRGRYEEPFGITEELVQASLGPDADEATEDELTRRLEEYLAPALFGEKAYRVGRLMARREGDG